jgi:biopolymer transport protein ExbD
VARSGGRRRRGLPLTADINVASLVDVAFTLLVIFIIAAPILQGGIEVQLPKAAFPEPASSRIPCTDPSRMISK